MSPKNIIALGVLAFLGIVLSVLFVQEHAHYEESLQTGDFERRGPQFQQGVNGLNILADALSRHFKATGRYPTSLDGLVPTDIKSLPTGPYEGKWNYDAGRGFVSFGVGPYQYPSCGRSPDSKELHIDQ